MLRRLSDKRRFVSALTRKLPRQTASQSIVALDTLPWEWRGVDLPLKAVGWRDRRLCSVFAPAAGDVTQRKLIGSWEDVRQTVATFEKEASTTDVLALLQAIPALGPPPTDLNLAHLLHHTSTQLPHVDAETLAKVYYWTCKSHPTEVDFLTKLAAHITQERDLETFSPKQLVLMVYSSGWMVRHHRREGQPLAAAATRGYPGMQPFVDRVSRQLTSPKILVQLKEQDLANSLYSLGLMKYGVNEVLYPLLHQIEQPQFLPRFLEQELANMLLGMASLELKGHPTVAVLASEVVERERLRMYKEPELCSLFYSLASLDYHNPTAIDILSREAIRSGRMGGYTENNLSNLIYSLDKLDIKDPRIWRLLLSEVTLPERLSKFEPHHLANILYAVGRGDYRNDRAMHQLMQEVCREDRLSQYSTREYGLMLYGMTRTDYRDPSILKLFSEELAKPGRLKEAGLAPKSLSGTLLSFSTLRHRNPDLIQQYYKDVLQREYLTDLDPEVLAQYIFCLGRFKEPFRGPAEPVVRSLVEAKEKLQALTHAGMGMLIYGLGQMGPELAHLMTPIVELLKNGVGHIERFSVQDLAMIVYSFGQMRLHEPDLIDRVLLSFTRPDRLHKASTRHLANLMYGLGQLRYPIKDLPLEMLEAELGRDLRVKSLSAQELANLVYSLGLLQIDHRPAIQRLIDKLTEEGIQPERLAQFQEMELNCFLTGLSFLKYREPTILVPLLEEITHPTRLQRLKEPEIASVLHVMAQLGVCPDELCEKLLAEGSKAERLAKYDVTSLVMMVYSLGRLQNQNYPESILAFSRTLLQSPNAEKLGEHHWANLLYGVVHTRHEAPEVLRIIFAEITKHHRLPQFHCNDIINVMRSVLLLRGSKSPVEGLENVARVFAIEMASLSRIPRYTPGQLTQILQILGTLQNKNVATVFPILKELTKEEKLHQLTSLEVARTVFSVGPLAFINRKLHPKLALAVKPLLKQAILGTGAESMNCHSMTELVVGMSMLGLKDTYLLDNLAQEVVKPARLRSFRAWHLSRIFYALAQLRYQNLELLRALAAELSKPDRAQRLDYRHWSNILSAVLMLRFKDEAFAQVIEKQIHSPPTPSVQTL